MAGFLVSFLSALGVPVGVSAATPLPVTLSSGSAGAYESVAASVNNQILGTAGAAGDTLDALWIQPGTTSPGNVIIKDGAVVVFTFPGGANSVSNLVPFVVTLGPCLTNWNITTGANVTCVAAGRFS